MCRKIIFLGFLSVCLFLKCTQESPKLTFMVGGAPNEVEYWEKLIKHFEDSTKIRVTVIRQPTDTDQRRQGLVIPLKAKKNDPDVFLMDVIWVAQFAASGWLLTIDPYVKKDTINLDNFFISIVNQIDIYDQKLVAFPVYNDCGLLYYRKDLLEKYQLPVPQTWQELTQTALLVQEQERNYNKQFYGFVWQGAQYEGLVCCFLEFAASNQGGIVNESGNTEVDRVTNIEALTLMNKLIHDYKISPPNTYTEMKEEEVRQFFENGNALYERNWPYAWGLHIRDGSPTKGKVGVSILPKMVGGKNAATLGGWHIGISKYSDIKDKAWQLLHFIISYNIQRQLALDLGWNPGRRDIYNDPEVIDKMPHITVLKKAFENAVARPNLPYYTQISEILQKYLNAALSDELEPAQALKNSQKEIDRIVKTYDE